jgi:hypothetical protein
MTINEIKMLVESSSFRGLAQNHALFIDALSKQSESLLLFQYLRLLDLHKVRTNGFGVLLLFFL